MMGGLDSYSWKLEFEDEVSLDVAEYGNIAPLQMVEFCGTIHPVLPSI
jgi:hypothetical protein